MFHMRKHMMVTSSKTAMPTIDHRTRLVSSDVHCSKHNTHSNDAHGISTFPGLSYGFGLMSGV